MRQCPIADVSAECQICGVLCGVGRVSGRDRAGAMWGGSRVGTGRKQKYGRLKVGRIDMACGRGLACGLHHLRGGGRGAASARARAQQQHRGQRADVIGTE
eukprot:scaffold9338_cov113-Isochrysis_galbana.AAC.9